LEHKKGKHRIEKIKEYDRIGVEKQRIENYRKL